MISTDLNNICCKGHKKIMSSLIKLDVSVISIIPYKKPDYFSGRCFREVLSFGTFDRGMLFH